MGREGVEGKGRGRERKERRAGGSGSVNRRHCEILPTLIGSANSKHRQC